MELEKAMRRNSVERRSSVDILVLSLGYVIWPPSRCMRVSGLRFLAHSTGPWLLLFSIIRSPHFEGASGLDLNTPPSGFLAAGRAKALSEAIGVWGIRRDASDVFWGSFRQGFPPFLKNLRQPPTELPTASDRASDSITLALLVCENLPYARVSNCRWLRMLTSPDAQACSGALGRPSD